MDTGSRTHRTWRWIAAGVAIAVGAVALFGVPLDLDPIRALCERHEIMVIVDAACAVGSTYKGRPVGAGANVAVWSFHPRKILTTGEGGMLTTSRPEWAARARRLREHAMSVSAADRHGSVLARPEEYGEIGFNCRMTDLQAAVGLVQLTRLPEIVARRRALAAVYGKAIADLHGLRAVSDPSWGTSNFQSYWVEVGPGFPLDREGLMAALAAAGISARRGIMAAHRQPAYGQRAASHLPVTDHLTDNTVILPLFHQLSDSEQARVIDVLREVSR